MPGRDRAAAIVLHDSKVALIERRNASKRRHYFTYPGGKVEPGESAESAAKREILEETGLVVNIGSLVVVVIRNGNHQYHFLASVEGGVFGTGKGPEMTRQFLPEDRDVHTSMDGNR